MGRKKKSDMDVKGTVIAISFARVLAKAAKKAEITPAEMARKALEVLPFIQK
jgi:hypothetical protein